MFKWISRLQALHESALNLWDEKIFRTGDEPSRFYKFLHFWVLVTKSFNRNRCPVRASALSYTTLLALIPMLAVALGVTSSLLKDEGEDRIERFIERFVASVVPPADTGTNTTSPRRFSKPMTPLPDPIPEPGPEADTNAVAVPEGGGLTADAAPGAGSTNADVTVTRTNSTVTVTVPEAPEPMDAEQSRMAAAQRTAAREINAFIQNTRSGTLGVTGTILLIMVAIRMVSRIEETFNDIWGVTCGRSWPMRIVMYWATITLGPLLLAGALGLSGSTHFKATRAFVSDMPFIGNMVFPTLTLLIIWLAFAMLYKAVPNTRVKLSAALVGGCVAGTLWHLNNVFGFLYVSSVVTNSKIYGSLGLVPVFMAGLFLSWLILLFGAQVAYAFQNRALYLQEKLAENVNQRGREFVALRLMTCIGQRFQKGLPTPSVVEMSNELGIPSRLIQQVLQTLVAAHLVVEVSGAEPGYAPARPLENITAHHILQAMRATQGQELLTRDEPIRAEVYGEFARIQEAEKTAASAITMHDLVGRAQARLELAPAPPADPDEMQLTAALKPSAEPSPAAVAERETTAQESSESGSISKPEPEPEPEPEAETPPRESNPASAPSSPAGETHKPTPSHSDDEERNFPL